MNNPISTGRTGGFVPPPESCGRLEPIVTSYGGSVRSTGDEARVNYALPAHASAEVREFLGPQSIARFDRPVLARLPGGRVFGSGNVLSPDGRVIARDVSSDYGKPFAEHWLLTCKNIRPPVSLSGTTAVIAANLGAGYGHWLLDELPRLIALKDIHAGTLVAHVSAVANEALSLRGFSGKLAGVRRFSHYTCDELIVPSLGMQAPATMDAILQFTAPLASASSPFGEKLYVSRERARRRRVANERELWTQLEARGFVKLTLEDLSWREQIAAFRGAKVIVAPHGAGLANLIFCRPGIRVVELFHREYVNGCYWRIAALRGLDYRAIVSHGPEPLTQTLRANRLDIEADVAGVTGSL